MFGCCLKEQHIDTKNPNINYFIFFQVDVLLISTGIHDENKGHDRLNIYADEGYLLKPVCPVFWAKWVHITIMAF